MYKLILFDIDGVLLRPPRYFSSILEEQGYPGAWEIVSEYYQADDSNLGTEDPLITVLPCLDKLGWKGSARDFFLAEWEYQGCYLDHALIQRIQKLRQKGIACHLATEQNPYRKAWLLDSLGFAKEFDAWHVSSDLGFRKRQPQFWPPVLERAGRSCKGIQAGEILFIDDLEPNITQAKSFGIQTVHFDRPDRAADLMSLLDGLIYEAAAEE